jgi:hypothetical protein
MALTALFDQDDLTLTYWAGLAEGDLKWPIDIDEEHPLRRTLGELEQEDEILTEGNGLLVPKNAVLLIDGHFAATPTASTEQAHFVQVLSKEGDALTSRWQDGAIFHESLLSDDPTPTELPKWYEKPDQNMNPKDDIEVDEELAEKRRLEGLARAARQRAEEARRQFAMDQERVQAEKRQEKAEKRAAKLRIAADEAEAAEEARRAAAAAAEAEKRGPVPADQWVGFDFADDKKALTIGDNTTIAGEEKAQDCEDLKPLEMRALAGLLTAGHVNCLERRMRHHPHQTVQNKISRLLMADAWSKKEVLRWEAAVKRHLIDIDRSDPDLCYLYARHQAQQGTDRVNEAIRWANVALSNNLRWEGDVRIVRMMQLHKLNARASQNKWLELESMAVGTNDVTKRAKAEFWRNQTKSYAREWLEFALLSESDKSAAYELCLASAGTREYCELR